MAERDKAMNVETASTQTKKATVLALLAEGLRPKEVAYRANTTVGYVYCVKNGDGDKRRDYWREYASYRYWTDQEWRERRKARGRISNERKRAELDRLHKENETLKKQLSRPQE
jgi:hypothetical protein